ncbi:prostaglandin g h synthase hypothetical protein [Limosa lapponica baueri]|uniref:Prostaglandin-endoperoxide synthase n=1 Tax=Limosa lapponica baueri TaxID=1758121 RepID=A0A2I0TV28_LIMLA|nr:prostaglandin g h synthase hypothetical protein [Limosa lapponica baueri]
MWDRVEARSHLIDSPPTYNSDYNYKSWEAYSNLSYYTRSLPPVGLDCPTPMGVKGKKELPDSKLIVEKFLLRKKFIPDPQGTNVMFTFFAQHFTHQFFKTDHKKGPGFTKALGHGVDLNHIYGETLERQLKLRLLKDGKLKYQMIDGEMYPPTVKDTQAEMIYPPHIPEHLQFSVGQEVFGLVPGLMMYATIWLREHNRVCDILKQEHPEWDDEQLFQTTRLILIGETIKIVIEDYVQHLSGYHFKLKFDPELLFNQRFQYQNRIAAEFNTLYHWHPLLPDTFQIHDQEYTFQQFLYNNSIMVEHGLSHMVKSFSKQSAGRSTLLPLTRKSQLSFRVKGRQAWTHQVILGSSEMGGETKNPEKQRIFGVKTQLCETAKASIFRYDFKPQKASVKRDSNKTHLKTMTLTLDMFSSTFKTLP